MVYKLAKPVRRSPLPGPPLCLSPSGGRGERRTTAAFFTNHYRLYKPCRYFYKP